MPSLEAKPLLLDVHSITLRVNHEEFEKLCQDNPTLRLELTKDGQLITMAPAGWESSKRNSKLNSRVDVWNERIGLGEVFDSSGGFTLPNGAVRSPDVTWIEKSKLEGISPDIAFPEVSIKWGATGLARQSKKSAGRNLSTRTKARDT
jgi:Uma2 family endonuclease